MGGFGSGRREYATTPTVGACHALDVNEFTDAVEHPGALAKYPWRDEHGHGETVATIGVHVEREGEPAFSSSVDDLERSDIDDALAKRATHLRLVYTAGPADGEKREIDERVRLAYTACPFGGVRPWFLCPGSGCGDRVGKLYRPRSRERFRCRECYDLGYETSRTSGDDVKQAELRYRRAFAKADAKDRRPHPNNEPWFPEKPSEMHYDTFDELCQDVRAASQEWDEAMMARVRELADRSGFVDGFDERVS